MYKVLTGLLLFISPFLALATNVSKGDSFNLSNLKNQKIISKIAYSQEWLKLVHYKKNIVGNYKSQVDGKNFFLSPRGKTSPKKELLATLRYIHLNKTAAYSDFPARYKLLSKKIGFSIPKEMSVGLADFLKKTKAESISIVFSSYYMNSPASIFGHTFIKLNSSKSVLLNLGINFTANLDDASGLRYMWKGFAGGFKGRYSFVPYHLKVREYNDSENRDVWLYHLNLTADELDTLLKHFWELMRTSYDYYFISENCSYHVLSALEAALPRYDLTDATKSIVLPGETIKILVKKGLIKKVEYQPALRNLFLARYNRLSRSEKKDFRQIIKKDNLSMISSAKLTAKLLDSLIDYYNFKYPSFALDQRIKKSKEIFNFKKKMILLRAKKENYKEVHSAETELDAYPPHLIHDARRFTIYGGYDGDYYLQLEFRLTFHDLSDALRGYPLNVEFEMFKFSGKIYPSEFDKGIGFYLEEITLIRYTSLSDFSFYEKSLAWGIYLGAQRFRDSRNSSEHGTFAPNVSLDLGISSILSKSNSLEASPSLLLFGLAKFDLSYSQGFIKQPLSFGIGPKVGFKFTLGKRLNLVCTYELMNHFKYDLNQGLNLKMRFQMAQNFSLDVAYYKSDIVDDYRFGLMLYF